jgi:O-antigen/teichoic acid export membrane protein
MLLNIVMNLILIPRLEAMGSAISSLTTQTLTAVIQVYIRSAAFGRSVPLRGPTATIRRS